MKKVFQSLYWLWIFNLFYLRLFGNTEKPTAIDLIGTGIFLLGATAAIIIGIWKITEVVFDL